tara:strand:- start:178 stop:534 length:357 start_codon:yes stop_codon:yes gene_type:complete
MKRLLLILMTIPLLFSCSSSSENAFLGTWVIFENGEFVNEISVSENNIMFMRGLIGSWRVVNKNMFCFSFPDTDPKQDKNIELCGNYYWQDKNEFTFKVSNNSIEIDQDNSNLTFKRK